MTRRTVLVAADLADARLTEPTAGLQVITPRTMDRIRGAEIGALRFTDKARRLPKTTRERMAHELAFAVTSTSVVGLDRLHAQLWRFSR